MDAGSGACTPSPTTIAIVEIMVSSRSGTGDLGEWFEIRNIGTCPAVTLGGLVVDGVYNVTGGVLAQGESYVFAQDGDAGDNHGLMHDEVYGNAISFANGGDSLVLTYMGTEVDRVTWGSTDYTHGASRQLSRTASPAANESLATTGVWCDSTAIYSMDGGTFRGTPKAGGNAHIVCP